jgi:hypothetical protein
VGSLALTLAAIKSATTAQPQAVKALLLAAAQQD